MTRPYISWRRLTMPSKPLRILHVDSAELDVELVESCLAKATDEPCLVLSVSSIPKALAATDSNGFDLILFSDRAAGSIEDSALGTFVSHVEPTPVILVIDETSISQSDAVIRTGVQDILARERLSAVSLTHAIHMAIARQRYTIGHKEKVAELESTCSRYQDLLNDNESARRTAEQMAKRADFIKTRLFAGMSHELRTPLNSILGYAEAMKIGLFGPLGSHQYSSYIDHIHTSGQHLLELIDKLMDLSQTASDSIEMRDEVVDMVLLVRAAIGVLARNAAEKLVSVEFAHEQARLTVRGDGARLLQSLLSIVSNAIKFTEPGGVVTIALGDRGPNGVILTTTDTGIGIAPAELPTIFEPFTNQVDGRTHILQGAGLGLSLAKNLIDLHEGNIAIDSRQNIGTVVTISLPRHRILEKEIDGETRLTA